MRTALLTALVAYVDESRKLCARRFLTGLSADEMEFIAEFLGASILEPGSVAGERQARPRRPSRAELAERVQEFQWSRQGLAAPEVPPHPYPVSHDVEHKMILLLEYLCRGAIQTLPAPLRSAQA